jgi:tRNA modification GTPase
VSGKDAYKIALTLTQKRELTPRVATLSKLTNEKDELLDEAIVIYFQAPHSFTGEDVVEFQCHGGIVVAEMILSAILEAGARLATPGEFSKRAVINGRMDLSKAEATAKLIESKSVDAARILTKQLRGDLESFVYTLRDSLVEILAFIEVNIDYAEEDLPLDLLNQIEDKLRHNAVLLEKSVHASKSREGLLNGFKVSIIGKPNVGKSSLLNALLSYNRAIISDIAGTTRDTIEEEIKIGTHLIKIVDTAGIREAHESIEKIGIERSIEAIEASEIVIALFDGSQAADKDDQKIIELIKRYEEDKEIITAINKKDLPQHFDAKLLHNPLAISSKEDTSLITQRLKRYLDTQSFEDDIILISKRQINATIQAYDAIEEARQRLQAGELELFAFHINEAIAHISSITKSFERDEILDKMFSSFCLGK